MASASTRRSIVRSSIRGGAWCGLILASMTRGPVQPQCLLWMNSPIPQMSAAGSERVKVTHKKFRSLRAVNSLSSTTTISGKRRIGSPPPKNRRKMNMLWGSGSTR